MAFEIKLYKNSSSENTVTKQIEELTTLNCILKDETNIYTPTIILELNVSYIDCNYIYIEKFNRYYFVENVEIKNSVIEMSLTCDVLMSFADEIKNNECIVARQSYYNNIYMNDDEYPILAKRQSVIKNFPSGFTNNGVHLMTVLGGDVIGGDVVE